MTNAQYAHLVNLITLEGIVILGTTGALCILILISIKRK